MNLASATALVLEGGTLTAEQMQLVVGSVLAPGFVNEELAALLVALADRGETAEEILGAVQALRSAMIPFQPMPDKAVDTCGTGGDGKDSFNVSTATAVVAAAAGAKVVKHGNRSVSSKCGSADLLEAAGVALELNSGEASKVLEECGLVFLYAPAFHPAMRHVAPVRRALGRRTLFNFVGPLVHPGNVRRQLLGISEAHRLQDYAFLLKSLGCARGYVVHGADGADELTLSGSNLSVAIGSAPKLDLSAVACGLKPASDDALVGGEVVCNLRMLHELFDGQEGAVRDVVLLNAATTLLLADVVSDLDSGVACAAEALDSGAAKLCLTRLAECSQRVSGGTS